jgi:hypothetical protein
MAVMAREAWTDERLDDLIKRADGGSADNKAEFRALRSELQAQSRMLIQLFAGMFATMTVGFLGTIATIITQT